VAGDEAAEVERVAFGDRAAYARLVTIHMGPIEAYALRMSGNAATAQDVVQEVMLRLWLKAEAFDSGKARLTTWLHQMAHNLCLDQLRREKQLTTLLDGRNDIEERLLHSDMDDDSDQVLKALSKLPERQRNALVLTYYQGLSNAEVAEVMDLGARAVESLLVRARASLRKYLEVSDVA